MSLTPFLEHEKLRSFSYFLPEPDSPIPGKWEASFWDMSAAPGGTTRCLYVHFCFPCASGDIAHRVTGSNGYYVDCICGGLVGMVSTLSSSRRDRMCLTCFEPILFSALQYFGFYSVPWACTRSRLRARDGIPGSYDSDCCSITWCPFCYLAQALNHLDIVDERRRVQRTAARAATLAAEPRMQSALTGSAQPGLALHAAVAEGLPEP